MINPTLFRLEALLRLQHGLLILDEWCCLRPYHSALPGGNATIYATVYGSWNTLLPQGHEIVRIDLDAENGNVVGTTTVFAEDVRPPLPIAFHPNGDLYFAVFGSNGKLYKITSSN